MTDLRDSNPIGMILDNLNDSVRGALNTWSKEGDAKTIRETEDEVMIEVSNPLDKLDQLLAILIEHAERLIILRDNLFASLDDNPTTFLACVALTISAVQTKLIDMNSINTPNKLFDGLEWLKICLEAGTGAWTLSQIIVNGSECDGECEHDDE